MSIKRVISFRPRGGIERGNEWAERLEKVAELIHLPLVEIVPVEGAADDLSKVGDELWLVFTSLNAVGYCRTKLRGRKCSIACVGEQTAMLLREYFLSVRFVPTKSDAETFVAELVPVLKKFSPVPKCLFLRGNIVAVDFAGELRKAGIECDERVVYESRRLAPELEQRQLLKSAAGDQRTGLLFTNSESVRALFEYFDDEKILKNPCFAIGPETERTLRDVGFERIVVASKPALDSLADAVLVYNPAG